MKTLKRTDFSIETLAAGQLLNVVGTASVIIITADGVQQPPVSISNATVGPFGNDVKCRITATTDVNYAINAMGYSDGLNWELNNFESLITQKGIILNEFNNGLADAFSATNNANIASETSAEFGGRGLKQYAKSTGTGTAVSGSIVIDCKPFRLRADTRIVCLWHVVNQENLSGSIYCSTQASNFAASCQGIDGQISQAIIPIEENGSYALSHVTGATLDSSLTGTTIRIGSLIDRIKIFTIYSEGSSATLLGVYLNPSCKPACHLSFDDMAVSSYVEGFTYMARKGFKGTMAINTANIGIDSSAYNLANMYEMDAHGWDMANHTHSHYYVNKPFDQVTVDSIAQAQTPGSAGAFLTLNGDIGSLEFDAPRQLTITLASPAYNKRFKIIGSLSGSEQTDVFSASDSFRVAGRKIWTKVDSVQAIDAVGVPIVFGVTSSYAEIYNEVNTAKQILLSLGFTRASDLFICPGGEHNAILLQVLRDLDYKYCRITDTSLNYPQIAPLPFHINATGSGIAAGDAAKLKAYADNLKATQSIGGIYLHIIVEDSATPTSTQARISDFRELVDYLAILRDSGALEFPKMRDVMRRTIS